MNYKNIAKVSIIAASMMVVGSAVADNVGQVAVTANTDFIVSIDDHAQDFSVDETNYASSENGGFSDYNIWSNANETVTVTVTSANAGDRASLGYLVHTNPGAELEVHEQIPYAIQYQPCGGGALVSFGGTGSFNLEHDEANKAICETTPGKIQVTRLAITDANGEAIPPAMGDYTANVPLTVEQPAGGGSVSIN